MNQTAADVKANPYRTCSCGALRPDQIGEKATLAGWVDSFRSHGEGLVFVDVRDREGVTQLVLDAEDCPAETLEAANRLRGEDVISATGVVRKRDGGINPKLPTGEIELVVQSLRVLNRADSLPFRPTDKEALPGEDVRLRYRHIDLRRPRMQSILRTRSKVCQTMRRVLDEQGFTEVETPTLFKTTPEGARDFLVPCRLQPGRFYALPQSPQILKQILMVSGMERYFQIVKCFRDEDLRADRQPEFTQLDLEMSFTTQEDVILLISELYRAIWREILGVEVGTIPQMTYAEAMERYGTDRPDTRFGLELVDVSDLAERTEFKVFRGALDNGGVVKAIRAPGGASVLTRKVTDAYSEFVKTFGAGGVPVAKYEGGAFTSGVAKFVEPIAEALVERLGLEDGDTVLFGADTPSVVARSLGELRLKLARDLDVVPADGEQWNFLWVVDFPLVEFDEQEQRWFSLHHPFTSPKAEDLDRLESDPGSVRSDAYDIVLNGSELGGGSIRIHDQSIQSRVFSLLGLTEEVAERKFGFFLKALRHGAPPHGGIALGLDRTIMHLVGAHNIRDVIAFPKTQTGHDLMADCPSVVDEEQLTELFLASKWQEDREGEGTGMPSE